MKISILKSQLALTLLALSLQAPIMAAPERTVETNAYDEDQLFELIILRMKNDVVDAMLDLAEGMTDTSSLAKETLDTIIKKCKDRLSIIENTILIPLEQKLTEIKQYQPNSRFLPIYEKTYALAKHFYTELNKLMTTLENHKKSADIKKVTAFFAKFKPHITKLTSDATLADVESKLNEIYALAQNVQASVVAKVNKEQVIASVQKRVTALQSKLNGNGASILAAFSNLLKRS